MSAFPGERFTISLTVLDQNNNTKLGFYTYPSSMFITEADTIQVDLTVGDEDTSFTAINGSFNQKTLLVIRNSMEDFSFDFLNHNSTVIETYFILNLVDSSTGVMVRMS